MKLSFGKKFVLFLHWLASLILAVVVALLCLKPEIVNDACSFVNQIVGAQMGGIVTIVLAAIYVLLSVLSVAFIFSREGKRGERGFITVDSSEAGRTRIAVGAVEQMIRQAVRGVDGIADMKSSIVNNDDAISISASVAIVSGAHVPTVTMNIQRAIRSYIELNCGVAVREVSVSVHSLENPEEAGKHGRRKGSFGNVPVSPVYTPIEAPVSSNNTEMESASEVDLTSQAEEAKDVASEDIPAQNGEEN